MEDGLPTGGVNELERRAIQGLPFILPFGKGDDGRLPPLGEIT